MAFTNPRSYLLAGLAMTALAKAADFQETSDNDCDCFVTNGTDAKYFTSHNFYDFRSLSQYANVPEPINDPQDSSNAPPASDYFKQSPWMDSWGIQAWNNSGNQDDEAKLLMVNSPSNVYIEKNKDRDPESDTFLTLRTMRHDEFQSAAEFESIPMSYHFLSARIYARTVGAKGAISAMFTYRKSDDPNLIQEADLEIRTIDPPDTIQYTNQPSYSRTGDTVSQATQNATVPRSWEEWSVHRVDWHPKTTTWYVDGQNVSQIGFQTPRDPAQVIFNMWSEGTVWTGNMTRGDAAYMQIQWIELLYNSTGDATTASNGNVRHDVETKHVVKRKNDGCKMVCSVDESHKIGTAVLVANDASSVEGVSSPLGFAFALFVTLFAMV
ncbi:xylanase 3 [Apiospora aurea]|uniref:Xylanase 3 n=1 Tax=Apiospora aurea TaxID=335848 RepID=A0ABR1PU20_9PEZI